jgi:hypothetical protein
MERVKTTTTTTKATKKVLKAHRWMNVDEVFKNPN